MEYLPVEDHPESAYKRINVAITGEFVFQEADGAIFSRIRVLNNIANVLVGIARTKIHQLTHNGPYPVIAMPVIAVEGLVKRLMKETGELAQLDSDQSE